MLWFLRNPVNSGENLDPKNRFKYPGWVGKNTNRLITITDLPQGLRSGIKLFAEDPSLFSVVNGVNNSVSTLNNDSRRF